MGFLWYGSHQWYRGGFDHMCLSLWSITQTKGCRYHDRITRKHGCMWVGGCARDCVTGLHDWRSRECNPVTPGECVLLSFCTNPCVLAFIMHILCTEGIVMALVCWMLYTFSDIFFQFAISFIALINIVETCHFKETRHGDGRANGAVTLLLLWLHATALWRHPVCDVTQCMNGLWIFITKLESPKGYSQT